MSKNHYKAGDVITSEYGDSYTLSANQALFCNDVIDSGYKKDLHFDYSGRSMYGAECPAVWVQNPNDIATTAKVVLDNFGMSVIIYARN